MSCLWHWCPPSLWYLSGLQSFGFRCSIWETRLWICTVQLHIFQQAKDGKVMRNEEKKGGKRWTSEFRTLWRYEDDLITYKLVLHCERKIWGGWREREEKWAIGASELEGRPNALGFEQSVLVGLSEGENSFQLWFHWSWVTRPDVCHFFSTNILLGSIFESA